MSEKEILCDRNHIMMIKKYDKNEDDIYEINYKCTFDTSSNIFEIINKNNFENLLFELNKDLISNVIKENKSIKFKLKNTIKDSDDIVVNYKISKMLLLIWRRTSEIVDCYPKLDFKNCTSIFGACAREEYFL